MKQRPITEPMYNAYGRYRESHCHAGWGDGATHPFIMRGEIELDTTLLPDRQYNKMLNAVLRGYLQEYKSLIPHIVRMATLVSPFKRFPVGYLGKTRFTLHMVDQVGADRLKEEILALNTMVDAINPATIRIAQSTTWGFTTVECYQYISSWDQSRQSTNYRAPTNQLKPLFTQLRTVIDNNMETWKDDRKPFVEWLRERPMLRSDFDSALNRREFNKQLQGDTT